MRNVYALVRLAVALVMLLSAPALAHAESDDEFLDDLQRRTFDFFWETAPAENGLTPDRWPSGKASSIAAVGFGLTSYCIGVERGWVEREEAVDRVLTTLRFFRDAPHNDGETDTVGWRGFYYHFLLLENERRWRKCELSSIDTALLMMGVLACREYFDGDSAGEQEVRELADALYRRVEWDWMQPRPPLISMAWHPERGGRFGRADYRGYDEAMFLYVLALGSPTHPIEPEAWGRFTDSYTWDSFYDQEHVNFTPLFGHQYAACWIDPRGLSDAYLRDKKIDYFENSRRATLAQRAYAIDNPDGWRGYGADAWGLTACDGPAGKELDYNGKRRRFYTYMARGASAEGVVDDGTIAPTAAGGSIPFAPEVTIPTLRAMRDRYGDRLYGKYGFLDAFNPSFRYDVETQRGEVDPEDGWVDSDYLGIDQGPILLMAENYRTGFVWELMRKNPSIRRGLQRAGLQSDWLTEATDE